MKSRFGDDSEQIDNMQSSKKIMKEESLDHIDLRFIRGLQAHFSHPTLVPLAVRLQIVLFIGACLVDRRTGRLEIGLGWGVVGVSLFLAGCARHCFREMKMTASHGLMTSR